MAILTDAHRQKVKELFDTQLSGPVEVLLFHVDTEEEQNQFTQAAREILSELASLSEGRITLREMPMAESQEAAAAYQIEELPAIVLLGEGGQDTKMRLYGAPLGYEFMVLLEDLVDVSAGKTRLTEESRQQLQSIQEDVTIQVFTTPT
ncbi:MAG: hypothetical protein ACOY93_04070 [Bacillota bacterium]